MKLETAQTPTRVDSSSRGEVSHDQIAQRADALWHERGRPQGEDEAIWLEAESTLRGELSAKPVSGTASRPYIDEPAIPLQNQTKSRDPEAAAAQTRSATEANVRSAKGTSRERNR